MKRYTDSELLDALEGAAKRGACPGLVNDDHGRWAVSEGGFQPVPEDEPKDMETTFFVEADRWMDSVRGAIIYWIENPL